MDQRVLPEFSRESFKNPVPNRVEIIEKFFLKEFSLGPFERSDNFFLAEVYIEHSKTLRKEAFFVLFGSPPGVRRNISVLPEPFVSFLFRKELFYTLIPPFPGSSNRVSRICIS